MKEDEKIRFNQKYELESYVSKLQFESESEIVFPEYVKLKGWGLRGPKYDYFFSYTEAAKEFNILSVHILKDLLCIYLKTSKSHLDEKILQYDMAIVKDETFNGKRVETFKLNSKGMNMIKNMMAKVEMAKSDTNQITTSKTDNEFNTERITQKETESKISNSLINKEPIQLKSEFSEELDQIETVTDIDGNVYKTVQIGNQVWMAEDLKVSRYRNGDFITENTNSNEWDDLKTEACYSDNPNNDLIYRMYYNWYAVSDERKIAPKGWHIPTREEWEILIDYVGGVEIAGALLKEENNDEFIEQNPFGFSATFTGRLICPPGCEPEEDRIGYWWSTTCFEEETVECISIYEPDIYYGYSIEEYNSYNNSIEWSSESKENGFTVRCIKD